MMGSAKPVRISARFACLIFLAISAWASIASATEPSLVVGESTRLQLYRGLPVNTSTSSKPGTSVVCERVHIRGLLRLKNHGKISHVVKVNVSQRYPSICTSKTEECLSWHWDVPSRSMSPFDHKILNTQTAGSSLEPLGCPLKKNFFSIA